MDNTRSIAPFVAPEAAARLSAREADAWVARYKWFVPARVVRQMVVGNADPQLALMAPWRAQSSLLQRPIDIAALTGAQEPTLRIAPAGMAAIMAEMSPESQFEVVAEIPADPSAVPAPEGPFEVVAEIPAEPAFGSVAEVRREVAAEVSADELIDRFLNEKDLRIVAQEGEPECEVRTQPQLDADDEVVSEQLASIYLAQGLTGQAVEIYRKLSLLNPEKSIYFAELIRRIENNN